MITFEEAASRLPSSRHVMVAGGMLPAWTQWNMTGEPSVTVWLAGSERKELRITRKD